MQLKKYNRFAQMTIRRQCKSEIVWHLLLRSVWRKFVPPNMAYPEIELDNLIIMTRLRIGKVKAPTDHLHGHKLKRIFWKTFRSLQKQEIKDVVEEI